MSIKYTSNHTKRMYQLRESSVTRKELVHILNGNYQISVKDRKRASDLLEELTIKEIYGKINTKT